MLGARGFLLRRERLWYHEPGGGRGGAGRRDRGVGRDLAKARGWRGTGVPGRPGEAPTRSARREDPAGSGPGWLSPAGLALGRSGPRQKEPPGLEPDASGCNAAPGFPPGCREEHRLRQVLLPPSATAEGGAEQPRLHPSPPTRQKCPFGGLETVPAERLHSSKPPLKGGAGRKPRVRLSPLLTFSFQTEKPQTLPELPNRGTETRGRAQRGGDAP